MRNLVPAALAAALLLTSVANAQPGNATPAQAKPTAPAKQAPAPTTKAPAQGTAKPTAKPAPAGPVVQVEPDFTIGAEDVLGVQFWRDPDMSGDVTVRTDGMITLPLIRDIKAAGLTPTQLADKIQQAVREYVTDASITVVVRQMNSRKAFITGEVAKPGAYPILSSSMTVMQLIAVAGGLTEWAKSDKISIMRVEAGKQRTFPFNYKDVAKGKKPEQNIVLRPGDTVVVPER
jgi:polysaccharide biosynthesis/export protein